MPDIEENITIRIKTETEKLNKLIADNKKLQEQIKKTGDQTGRLSQKLQQNNTQITKTATSINDLTNSLQETSQSATKAASSLDKVDSSARSASSGATQAGTSMLELSTSMIGLGQNAVGAANSIFGMQERIVALERSTFGFKQTTLDLRRQIEDFHEMLAAGTADTKTLKRGYEDLQMGLEDYKIEAREVAAESQALTGEFVGLGIELGTTAVQTAIAAKSLIALRGIRAASVGAIGTETVATVANTTVTAGNTAGKVANTVATGGLTLSIKSAIVATRALTVSMLASPMAPFAIAAIGAGAAFVALNDNIGGVRDSIEDLAGADRGSIPTLGFSLTGLGSNMNDAAGHVDGLAGSIEGTSDATNELEKELAEIGEKLGGYTQIVDGAAQATWKLGDNMINMSGSVHEFYEELKGGDNVYQAELLKQNQFATKLSLLNKSLQDGTISTEEYNLLLPQLARQFQQLSDAEELATGSNEAFIDTLKGSMHNFELEADAIDKVIKKMKEYGREKKSYNEALVKQIHEMTAFELIRAGITVNPLTMTPTQISELERRVGRNYNKRATKLENGNTLYSDKYRVGSFTVNEPQLARYRKSDGSWGVRAIPAGLGLKSYYTLDQVLGSKYHGYSGRDIVKGTQISNYIDLNLSRAVGYPIGVRDAYKYAGINLGGGAASAIASFNRSSGNNYANPRFKTGGGFIAGGASVNRKSARAAERRRAKANVAWKYDTYENYFGEKHWGEGNPNYPKGWSAKTKARMFHYRFIKGAQSALDTVNQYKTQFGQFPVPLNFTERYYNQKIGRESYYRRTGSWGRNLTKYYRDIYGDVLRSPTRKEALTTAYKESLAQEKIYNEIRITNRIRAAKIKDIEVRLWHAEELLQKEIKRIDNFEVNAGLSEEKVVDFLKTWDGEWHLNNIIKYRLRTKEIISLVT